MTRKIALSYSGGPEASALLLWLKETRPAPVVAFTPDLGQSEDMGALARRAAKAGADKVIPADLRDEFARDFIFTALKANAAQDGAYLMGAALARPLVAKVLVKIAKSEGCDAVAHGAAGDDQARFELAVKALAPELEVLAPGRAELADYAKKNGLAPDDAAAARATDANLMHVLYEGGLLDDPWTEPAKDLFRTTKDPAEAPDAAEVVEIEFADGTPAAVNKESLAPAKLILKLNEIAGRHGVGRADVVGNRFLGLKTRGVYETPGVTVLHLAQRAVESLTMDREVSRLRDSLMPAFASLVYDGLWFSPEMGVLRALIEESKKGVTGLARIRLYKGLASVAGRKSGNSLLAPPTAGLDAAGFVRMNAPRLSLNKSLRRGL